MSLSPVFSEICAAGKVLPAGACGPGIAHLAGAGIECPRLLGDMQEAAAVEAVRGNVSDGKAKQKAKGQRPGGHAQVRHPSMVAGTEPRRKQIVAVDCPYCEGAAELRAGSTVGSTTAEVWVCRPCRAWVGVFWDSPVKKPMGTPAKDALRGLRVRAGALLSEVTALAVARTGWHRNHARLVTQKWLSAQLGMQLRHMSAVGWMDEAMAARAIAALEGLVAIARRKR